jgi:hypothetical protein
VKAPRARNVSGDIPPSIVIDRTFLIPAGRGPILAGRRFLEKNARVSQEI